MNLRLISGGFVTLWMLAHAVPAIAAAPAPGGVSLPPYTETRLANGVQLLLMEKRDVPLVSMTALLRGGPLGDAPGREGTAALLADLLRKGAGKRNAAAFAEAVEAAGGEIDTAAARESLSVSARFLARDTDLMLELVADLLLRPRLDAGEFDKLRTRAIDALAATKDSDPNTLLAQYGDAWLFGTHGYARPADGDETSLAAITLADVQAWYRNHAGGDRLIVAVAGDFSASSLKRELERAIGRWQAAAVPLPQLAAAAPQTGRRVLLVDKPGATQTYFWLGNVGTTRTDPRRAAQTLVNSAFGGRFTSMLMTELRTRTGLSYSASSAIARPSQPGSLAIRSFTATETTAAALDLALETLARLHRDGLDAVALQSSQKYELGSFPPKLETGTQLAARLAEMALHGLGRDDVDGHAARVQAATAADARSVIDSLYPRPDNLAIVLIGDAQRIRSVAGKYGPLTEMKMSEPRFRPPAPALQP